MSDNNSCFTCEYYSEFDGVCCNADSEHCADFIDGESVCDKYKKTSETMRATNAVLSNFSPKLAQELVQETECCEMSIASDREREER